MSRPLPRGTLTINPRHPDARGLVFAYPCGANNTLPTQSPKLARGQFPGVGTNYTEGSFVKTRYGWGLRVNATTNGGTQWTGLNLSNNGNISISVLGMINVNDAGYAQNFFWMSGVDVSVAPNSAAFSCNAVSYGPAVVVGQMYQIGLSMTSASSGFFYVNGQRFTMSSLPTVGTGNTGLFTFVGAGSPIDWTVADIRVWNRRMPDSTFMRHYVEGPSRLYAASPRGLARTAQFNGGRFFPFLHPGLSS